jgi:hypothetical protein
MKYKIWDKVKGCEFEPIYEGTTSGLIFSLYLSPSGR